MRAASLFVAGLLVLLYVAPTLGETPKEPTDDTKCCFVSQETSPPYAIAFDCSKICDRPTEAAPGTAAYALWHRACDPKKSGK
jgi:hypothetical protein